MKIRDGWVSNSSSTSFAIMGRWFDKNDLVEYLENMGVVFPKDEDYNGYVKFLTPSGIQVDSFKEYVQEAFSDLSVYYSYDSGGAYVGISFQRMEDNETKTQLKQRVESLYEKYLGKKLVADLQIGEIYG